MHQEYNILVALLEPRNDFHLEDSPNNIALFIARNYGDFSKTKLLNYCHYGHSVVYIVQFELP